MAKLQNDNHFQRGYHYVPFQIQPVEHFPCRNAPLSIPPGALASSCPKLSLSDSNEDASLCSMLHVVLWWDGIVIEPKHCVQSARDICLFSMLISNCHMYL